MPVVFAGAGPGDPGLLTLAAAELLEEADVVLHDELVPDAITSHLPNAERYRGIEHLLDHARSGKRVVRLQIGDPSIFGRLIEQMEALDEAGIEYRIIPGVTAACAAAAAAKISLTHRTLGRSLAIVSAHDPSIPIPGADTVVFYMGRPERPGPVLVVENASRPDEKISRDPGSAQAPSVVISGAVAGLDALPLYELRVVVTRAETERLSARLRVLGAEPVEFPVIQIAPPLDAAPLHSAIARLPEYDWIVFTSANGVRAFFDRIDDLRPLRARLCAIGPATREAVERHKLRVDVTPPEYVGESLASAMPGELTGQRILIPRAAVARDVVPAELQRRGAQVEVVEAYRTIVPDPPPPPHGPADWITFTSSSTVKNYLALAGSPGAKLASIGPVTSATLRQHGLEPDAEARQYTTDGIVEAILEHEMRSFSA
jgi:uroporphyrinogen III methyltransferase/synthase